MESKQRLHMLALLSFFFFLLFFATTNASSSSPDDDLHTLLSFKSLINKDPSGVLSSWNALSNSTSNGTYSFCTWTGVTCGGHLSPHRVTALRLPGLGLTGSLSPHIGNLTYLSVLDLSGNNLEGEIPPSIASCNVLRKLNLSTNSLSGAIPSAIGRLSKLAFFDIGSNNISGLIPSSFANLSALAAFRIFENSVHGNIPPWLGNLSRLTYLNIEENKMTGTVPPLLSKLPYLQSLGISANMLEGEIPASLFNMTYLESFYVGNNNLSGSLPPDMGFTLPSLRNIYAYNNEFDGTLPFSWSNISVLEAIVIDGNRFRGRIPPNIGRNGLLTRFDVGDNDLQVTKPADWDFLISLTNCSRLVSIGIQSSNISGTLPSTVANLSLELERMWFEGNQIAGQIPTGIGRYYKLTLLAFNGNLLTGTIPPDIGKLSSLQGLFLDQNAFHGKIPLSIGNMTQLNWFDLSSNYLEGTIPRILGNLSFVTYINISNNLFSGQIPQEIVSITSLSQLCDLSNNALTGSIPLQIGNLVNLVQIDLSSNKLSGEIPKTLGRCLELQSINFQGNLLQGQIPTDLSVLKGLEFLDLSNNKLSGPIPEYLGSFKLLSSLNLSFNQLSGPVPNKGIFSNASAVSLASNGALCGGPPFFSFPPCPFPIPGSHSRAHKLPLHTLIFIVLGALSVVTISFVTCYNIKKLRSNPVDSNQDQACTFVTVMYQRISYAELCMVTDSFSIENLVGRGSYSSVYKGILSCGRHSVNVAVKVLDLQQRGAIQSFISECNALKRIKHRKLVKVITMCDSLDHNGDEFKALVLEFISKGSLDKWLHPSSESMDKLSVAQRLSIALDVAEALEYLHHQIDLCIAHCDVKPSNILLDEDMTAHLSDFGLAKIMNVEASSQSLAKSSTVGIKGTIGYIAPECGMGTAVCTEGDIFSYGVVLLEILTGRRPTDNSFHDARSLPSFVQMAYPDKLLEIMDPATPRNGEERDMIDLYIAPISRLGLACCRDSPRQRMKMGDVVKELSDIKIGWERKFNPIVDP
ncbi:hypothetical protein U9M48_005480 [Paspalum notatum var. saurae]|uniref:Receptor kinase-like protein Xa21 n=1 Tax=Paspalum notatum var. saurae TaxID=547442 RepID=A0AAQ3SK08_PASNO